MAAPQGIKKLQHDAEIKCHVSARLGNVPLARVTQIMNLHHLAPGIQDRVLARLASTER